MNKYVICIFALYLVSCQTTQIRPITTIDALQITDSSGSIPYAEVVGVGATSSINLPLPEYDIHIASLPLSAKWMDSYNFDNNNSLSRAEITNAWLVQIAIWKTGKPYSPSALSINSPATGIIISLDDNRKVRAILDQLMRIEKANNKDSLTEMVRLVTLKFAPPRVFGGKHN